MELYTLKVGSLMLDVEIWPTHVIVSERRFDAYGVGTTCQEATEDFVSMLIDLLEDLTASEDVLSTDLMCQLNLIRAYAKPR